MAKLDERLAALSAEIGDGTLLVELAGGILVPYDDRLTQADWLARIRPRIVLVARSGLGTLNHTLLTLEALRARDAESLEQLVFRSMEIKARVVRRDERESGRRAMLNFGHTVAHALEAVSGYSMRHGPAVSLGLCVESRLAESVSGLPAAQRKRIERLLAALGLPVGLGPEPGSGGLVEAARLDKKNRDGRIRCALPVALGRMPPGDEVTVAVEERQLLEAIEASRAEPAD